MTKALGRGPSSFRFLSAFQRFSVSAFPLTHACTLCRTLARFAVRLHASPYACTLRRTLARFAVRLHASPYACTLRRTLARFAVRLESAKTPAIVGWVRLHACNASIPGHRGGR